MPFGSHSMHSLIQRPSTPSSSSPRVSIRLLPPGARLCPRWQGRHHAIAISVRFSARSSRFVPVRPPFNTFERVRLDVLSIRFPVVGHRERTPVMIVFDQARDPGLSPWSASQCVDFRLRTYLLELGDISPLAGGRLCFRPVSPLLHQVFLQHPGPFVPFSALLSLVL